MPLFALGLNHRSAPVAIRERVAFSPDSLAAALTDLAGQGLAEEAALVSTCNRTELYCHTATPEAAAAWLAARRGVAVAEIAPYLYTLTGPQAVRHVFRVASGLDSMVLGETQILRQLKEAARVADACGMLGAFLHRLFQNGFAVAKEVRARTAIGANVVSIAAAAVRVAAEKVASLSEARILFVGAGTMVELCASHFAGAAPRHIAIANRSRQRAEALAPRFGAEVLPLKALGEALPHYDVVVACTASPLPLLSREMVARALEARGGQPLVLIDLAVPRDIEAEVADLAGVFLYTIDDLARIVGAGLASRQAAVAEAEAIIATQVGAFHHWLERRETVPTIRQLREQAEAQRRRELAHAQRQLAAGEAPLAVLDALSRRLSNKLLHAPTRFLGQAEGDEVAHAVASVQRVFGLDSDSSAAKDS